MNYLPNLISDWQAPLRRSNYLFTFAFFTMVALVGSASAILFIGAGIWAIVLLSTYRLRAVRDIGAIVLAVIFGLYYLSGLFNAIAHWGDRSSLFQLIERLPFLAFLPVVSRLSLSNRTSIWEAMECGAFAGIVVAVPVVLVQALQSNARPEAFSGNSSIFALAMTVLFVICCVAARRRGGRAELLFAIAASAAMMCIFVAGTRAFWPMLAIGPLISWIVVRQPQSPRILNWKIVALLLVSLAIVAIAASEKIGKRVDLISQELSDVDSGFGASSLNNRLAMWNCAIDISSRHFLAGAGVDGARRAMKECAAADDWQWQALSHFHNFALDGLATGGIVELAARLALLIGPLMIIVRTQGRAKNTAPAGGPLSVQAVLVILTFTLSGVFGIFVGHDIADALYLYCIICLYCIARMDPQNEAESRIVKS